MIYKSTTARMHWELQLIVFILMSTFLKLLSLLNSFRNKTTYRNIETHHKSIDNISTHFTLLILDWPIPRERAHFVFTNKVSRLTRKQTSQGRPFVIFNLSNGIRNYFVPQACFSVYLGIAAMNYGWQWHKMYFYFINNIPSWVKLPLFSCFFIFYRTRYQIKYSKFSAVI